jgi:hypothetical protein
MDSILSSAIALRQQAFEALEATPAYAQLKALDAAVVAMGGKSIWEQRVSDHSIAKGPLIAGGIGSGLVQAGKVRITGKLPLKRMSHAQAAYAALLKHGIPMQTAELMQAATQEGAYVGGERPMVNFTSSLSRDDRLISVKVKGAYYWWIENQPWPLDTTPDLPTVTWQAQQYNDAAKKEMTTMEPP